MFSKKNSIRSLVEDVKSYAAQNYERNGWDYVIETMDDWDIADVIKSANNAKGAIWLMSRYIKPMADYRAEVRAEIW